MPPPPIIELATTLYRLLQNGAFTLRFFSKICVVPRHFFVSLVQKIDGASISDGEEDVKEFILVKESRQTNTVRYWEVFAVVVE